MLTELQGLLSGPRFQVTFVVSGPVVTCVTQACPDLSEMLFCPGSPEEPGIVPPIEVLRVTLGLRGADYLARLA